MSKQKIEQSKEWLASMNEILSKQTDEEKIEHMRERIDVQKWLIERVELLQQFAEKNTELNVFLQKHTEPKHLGRNVIDVAMDIITEQAERVQELTDEIYQHLEDKESLEEQNKHYREKLEQISGIEAPGIPLEKLLNLLRRIADEALEESE